MTNIYALSDIHGLYESMLETLSRVDFEADPDSKFVFLGDYIDIDQDSAKVLYHIYDLHKKFPEQVIALLGNHEEYFIDFLFGDDDIMWLQDDNGLTTIRSFVSDLDIVQLSSIANSAGDTQLDRYQSMRKHLVDIVLSKHSELMSWLKKLPVYYETEDQIFVHAGVDEETGVYWKDATEKFYFTQKYPASVGKFIKDIVAGHVAVNSIANDFAFNEIYYDGFNHYYIDAGSHGTPDHIGLLKFDTQTKKYTGFKKILIPPDSTQWVEYPVRAYSA
jgi:serine/threonine protein phosphatase 1